MRFKLAVAYPKNFQKKSRITYMTLSMNPICQKVTSQWKFRIDIMLGNYLKKFHRQVFLVSYLLKSYLLTTLIWINNLSDLIFPSQSYRSSWKFLEIIITQNFKKNLSLVYLLIILFLQISGWYLLVQSQQ